MSWCVVVVCDDKDDADTLARGARMMNYSHLYFVRELEIADQVVLLVANEATALRKVMDEGGTVQVRECACCGIHYRVSWPEGSPKYGSKYCPPCQLLLVEFRRRYVTNKERINAIRGLMFAHTTKEVR